jgi:hypothetical protein
MSMGITIFNNSAGGGGGAAPSGVLFKTIEPSQYTSYRTGDEGDRVQNGWFDYTPPSNPAAVAELDYSSANYFWLLKNNLVVNGVSSKTRFVDVDGGQTFSATGNKNLVVIDKLTGMMYSRNLVGGTNWDTCIDSALSYSIVVNGITLDDWFLYSKKEAESVYQTYASVALNIDGQTGIVYFNSAGNLFTSTTDNSPTTSAYYWEAALRVLQPIAKTTGIGGLAIRNARNLITAP